MNEKGNTLPLVSICCITYNHESYIRECLNGFISQKTNFPVEIVISNDCSTDNTQLIIDEYKKQYPDIFRDVSPHQNLGAIQNFYYTLNKCKGKYIAFCEGDDYWIDENKLQMQVDFLENNPEYGMCYTKAKQLEQKTQKFYKKMLGEQISGFEDLLVNGDRIPTLTTMYSKYLLDKYQREINPSNKGWLMGDYPMWLYFSHESKVHFIDEVTAVYRVLENSASHSVDEKKELNFRKSIYQVRSYYSSKYDIDIEIYDEFKEYFYILYRKNIKCYTNITFKEMAIAYKQMKFKTIKERLIYFFSMSKLSFKLFRFGVTLLGTKLSILKRL